MRSIFCLVFILFLNGCASNTQFNRNANFSSNSSNGLVVLGVDVQSDFKSPTLVFMKYDPVTGKVDTKTTIYIEPRTDKMTGSEKFGAFMTGQTSRPKGHDYFVFEAPPGSWFLFEIFGSYNDGLGKIYFSDSFPSKGTISISSIAGKAIYVGEYVVSGRFGESLSFMSTKSNILAAQSELGTFSNVRSSLVDAKPMLITFNCKIETNLVGRQSCDTKSLTINSEKK